MRAKDLFATTQPRLPWRRLLFAAVGVAGTVAVLGALGGVFDLFALFVGFAPTCVLVFALPEAPVSQPSAVIGGQLSAALVGVVTGLTLPASWWSAALAAGLAFAAMALLRVLHPPAVANAVIASFTGAGWTFLLIPVLAASATIVALAILWHRATRTQYPHVVPLR